MSQIQPPTTNAVSQGKHGQFNAVDYRGKNQSGQWNLPIYAMEDGKVTFYGYNGDAGKQIQQTSADGQRRWGYAHTNSMSVKVGDTVKRGQLIGIMGYTGKTIPAGVDGTRVHVTCRLANGTYVYPPTLINTTFSVYSPPKPSTGRIIHLDKGTTSTVFRRDNGQKVGTIYAKDDSYNYVDRGQDPKFPNRRYITSASAGGDVSIAMTYTDGKPIEGRRYK